MKNLILSLFLLASVQSASAAEGAGGHGGDPFITQAEVYPDSAKLNRSVVILRQKLVATDLQEQLKQRMLAVLDGLVSNKRMLYLDSIILIESESSDTYKLPQDLHSFRSLGAMTSLVAGSPIYLSKKTLSYSDDKLAQILTHELLHQTLESLLASDERFIDDLVAKIWSPQSLKRMNQFIAEEVYIVPGEHVSLNQILNSRTVSSIRHEVCSNRFESLGEYSRALRCNKELKDSELFFSKAFGANNNNDSIIDLYAKISDKSTQLNLSYYFNTEVENARYFANYIRKVAKALNFESKINHQNGFCIDWYRGGIFGDWTCAEGDKIKLSEYFQ